MPRFHFALNHLEDTDSLQISLHDETFELSTHTEDSLNEARNQHPVLSQLPGETAQNYTHYADIPDEQLDHAAPRWVQIVKPRQPGSHLSEVLLMAQIIPPAVLRDFYKSPMWKERHTRRYGRHLPKAKMKALAAKPPHRHGRLHSLGVNHEALSEDQLIEAMVAAQDLVDIQTSAAGLLAHHPDLAMVPPVPAAYIRDAVIFPDPEIDPNQYNAVIALGNAIGGTPSWSPIVDCKDKDGNPIKAEYDLGEFKTGDTMQTFSIKDNVLKTAAPALTDAQRSASDDMQLKNQLWNPTPGTSVLKSSGEKKAAVQAADLLGGPEYKWTVPYQTFTYGIKLDEDSLKIDDQNNFSIDCYNKYARTICVAYELFDANKNSLGKRVEIDGLSAVDSIMGIPIPVFPTTQKFNIKDAYSVKIYFGSLGASNWDKVDWGDMNVSDRGALLTAAWQYGVPILFMIAGKAITDTKTFNKIVNDKELRLAAIAILAPMTIAGVATKSALTNWQQTMIQFADIVLSFAVKKGMEALGKWIVKEVGAGQLSKAFGPIGWLFQLAAVILNVEGMLITTAEVLSSDSLVTAEIKRAIDVSLVLKPDPRHGEAGNPGSAVWPSVGTKYIATLQVQGGTNFEQKGELPSTTSGTPIPITFENVPGRSKFRIFIGIYSENGWLAGSWQNNWTDATPNDGTTLKLGDQNIKENLVPLGIDTQYVYKEKIAYKDSKFSWTNASPAPTATLSSLSCDDNRNALCELTAITINNSAFQVGYAWRAANQHLHPDSPGAPVSDKQLYALQNLSVLEHPGARLITTNIGLTQKPGIAYAPSTNTEKTIDQTNFILDPRGGRMNLRQVTLGTDDKQKDFGLGEATLLSWGSFPIDNLDTLAIHPSNAVLACSFSKHKLMILNLPEKAVPDADAPEALPVSGEGVREGLMKGPKALAVAPDGRILILESLNNRVQAFDTSGNAVPSFTPNDWIFELDTAQVSADLDAEKVPSAFLDGLIANAQNPVAPLPNNSYIAQLDGGKFKPDNDRLINALARLNINLSYDPANMSDPTVSAQIEVVKAGASWIITDPRKQAWQIVNEGGILNVYMRPVQVDIEVQKPGNRWLLRDYALGLAWLLTVSSGAPGKTEVFECLTYFPLEAGPGGENLNYLDMAVEAQGYMYILSYINDGAATTDYLLDVYNPDGTFLFRSPDKTKTDKPQNIVAGRIAVDIWRDLYALNFETINGPNGAIQPGIAHWMPTPPLFDFPLAEQKNFNDNNISAVKLAFSKHKINLTNQAFIETINRDGYWMVKDGNVIYHIYRSGDGLQVYSIPA